MASELVEYIKQVRAAHGISIEEIGRCMPEDPAYIADVESGKRHPPDWMSGKLIDWVKLYMRCCQATTEEQSHAEGLAQHEIRGLWADTSGL